MSSTREAPPVRFLGGSASHAEGAFRRHVPTALLLLAVAAVYGRTLTYPFVNLDDLPFIQRNPFVQGGLSLESVRWAFTSATRYDPTWMPVTWISRLLDVTLFGMDSRGHHLGNVLLHMGNVALLYHLLRGATGRKGESLLAAALFAVHPLHVESVAWVIERKDVLSTFFLLLALRAYGRYVAHPGRGRYGALLLWYALSLLSKPVTVTFPFLLLLLDYWPLRRVDLPRFGPTLPTEEPRLPAANRGRILAEKVPLLALSVAASAVALAVRTPTEGGEGLPVPWRLANALVAWTTYLGKAAWPSGLAVYYPHPERAISVPLAALSGAFLAAVSVAVLREAGRRRWLVAGWFWYLAALVPTSGVLVPLGGYARADRFTYLPLLGVYVAAAWGAAQAAERLRLRRAATFVAAAWVLALAGAAVVQVGYWKDSVTLLSRALSVSGGTGNGLILNNLGEALIAAGRSPEAVPHCREAVRINPGKGSYRHNLGHALLDTGQIEEARAELNAALALSPPSADLRNLLGVADARQRKWGEAIVHFREALRIQPDHGIARRNLERALAMSGG